MVRYKAVPVLLTTAVTTPQNELSNSGLTQANYRRELEKAHQQLGSQAASAFNITYNSLESAISSFSPKTWVIITQVATLIRQTSEIGNDMDFIVCPSRFPVEIAQKRVIAWVSPFFIFIKFLRTL